MGGLFVILVNIVKLSFIITTVSSVEICSNDSSIGELVSFTGKPENVESCGCSVKLVGGEEISDVTFQKVSYPTGCQYKLMFKLKTARRDYSCTNYPDLLQFTMSPTDQLDITLVKENNKQSGFIFSFNIQTKRTGRQLRLTCHSPGTKPTTQIVTTRLATAQIVISQKSTSQTPSQTGDNNIHYTSTTDTSGESESTETTDRGKTTEESQNLNIPVIVGCTVGGVVLVSVIVVMLMCFWNRRKQKQKTGQDVSDQNFTERHVYSNIVSDNSSQTQHQNTVNIPNNVYSSLDKTSSALQQYQHLQKQDNDITEQQERVSEQQGDVPHTNNEYVNVPEKSIEGSSPDYVIEHNKISPQNVYSSLSPTYNNSIDKRPYEHLPKQEKYVTEQQQDVPGQYENALKQ